MLMSGYVGERERAHYLGDCSCTTRIAGMPLVPRRKVEVSAPRSTGRRTGREDSREMGGGCSPFRLEKGKSSVISEEKLRRAVRGSG